MLESFEKSVKPTFKDSTERSFVKFGSMRDRDPSVGIRSGQLPLEGYALHLHYTRLQTFTLSVRTDIEAFFEPSIVAIIDAVKRQRSAATKAVSVNPCHIIS